MQIAPYDFDRPLPLAIRIMLLGVGVFAIVMPIYDFWRVLLHPSILTLVFGAIVLTAGWIGIKLIHSAIAGAHQQWRFEDGRLVVHNSNLLRSWEIVVDREQLRDSFVRVVYSDTGPDSHCVVLNLRGGTVLETNGLDTPEQAEAFRQRIHRYIKGR